MDDDQDNFAEVSQKLVTVNGYFTYFPFLLELERQNLITIEAESVNLNQSHTQVLMLLGRTISETLQRYAITLNLLASYPELSKTNLESHSQEVAQRLGRLHGINAPEFVDKGVFSALFVTLKQQGYIDSDGNCQLEHSKKFADELNQLLSPEVQLTIQESIYQVELN